MATARDIMTSGVEGVGADDTLSAAARKMRDLDVGALPVLGPDGRLRGVVTDRDIVLRAVAEGRDAERTTAGEVAGPDLHTVAAGDDAETVVRTMGEHQVRRVPVLDGDRLVGMISEADLARHLPDELIARFVERVYAP
ncbi:CBS domain-containing protein [Actinomadura kijaniata]|uniref:CBS domain-containing protein n=1 Tax=Actinomadura kijaniata TaxID=46161 RepID=UPI0008336747|nr:CBS domain-containing protein [Actinomadura kijaniata]